MNRSPSSRKPYQPIMMGYREDMPKNTKVEKVPDAEEPPIENQRLNWADENRDLEGRKPDLAEIDEDASEL